MFLLRQFLQGTQQAWQAETVTVVSVVGLCRVRLCSHNQKISISNPVAGRMVPTFCPLTQLLQACWLTLYSDSKIYLSVSLTGSNIEQPKSVNLPLGMNKVWLFYKTRHIYIYGPYTGRQKMTFCRLGQPVLITGTRKQGFYGFFFFNLAMTRVSSFLQSGASLTCQ